MNRLLFNGGLAVARPFIQKVPHKLLKPNVLVKESTNPVFRPIACQFSTNLVKPLIRCQSSYAAMNIDVSNLSKDVIVYKYENPRHFKIMNVCGIVQFFFFLLCAEFTLSNLKDVPVDENDPDYNNLPFYAKTNLGENKYKFGLAFVTFLVGKQHIHIMLKDKSLSFPIICIGFVILGFVWVFTLRSVRYLVLRKGGNKVSFVTYGPFGTNHIMDVPLRCVTAVQSRDMSTGALPIKVKDRTFYYMLDNRGVYTNPDIFDHVVNVKRRI